MLLLMLLLLLLLFKSKRYDNVLSEYNIPLGKPRCNSVSNTIRCVLFELTSYIMVRM